MRLPLPPRTFRGYFEDGELHDGARGGTCSQAMGMVQNSPMRGSTTDAVQ